MPQVRCSNLMMLILPCVWTNLETVALAPPQRHLADAPADRDALEPG